MEFDANKELLASKINPLEEVERPQVAIQINSQNGSIPSFTLGNFSMVIGKAKSKKTFLIGVMTAAAINGEKHIEIVEGTLTEGKTKVLYFDTEQGKYHANRAIRRIAYMTGFKNPDNLHAYGLRRFSPKQRLLMIEKALEEDGIGLVFIDGGRDLLSVGINDERDATVVTSKFLRWTEENNIHICIVLHQNKNDLNARGHFGTECVNKAETTISVKEAPSETRISVVSCEYSRELKFADFAFGIDDEGIPVYADIPANYYATISGQSSGSSQAIKRPDQVAEETHKEVVRIVFEESESMGYKATWEAIKASFRELGVTIGNNTAIRFMKHYHREKGWILKEGRTYIQGNLE